MELKELLSRYKRIAICGGPITGKTIITEKVSDRPVIHSDDYHVDWSTKPHEVLREAIRHDSFVVAGVTVDRAIRKGLRVDAIVHCVQAHAPEQTKGQKVLKKQIDKRTREMSRQYNVPLYVFEGRKRTDLWPAERTLLVDEPNEKQLPPETRPNHVPRTGPSKTWRVE